MYDGNRLKSVLDDALPVTRYATADFADLSDGSTEYAYDECGAMISDTNQGIMSISYDNCGNPRLTQFSTGEQVEYVYTPSGQKVREIHRSPKSIVVGGPLPAPHEMDSDTTDYIGPAVYRNGQPDIVRYTGGYASLSKSGSKYVPAFHHYITDYLGNNRAVVRASDGAFVQITHYYPWGSVYGDMGTGASLQPYKYGDKELDLTAGVVRYDYAARAYFAAIPRFDRPDALAGKYPHHSPYVFCANNPVNVIDPTGMNWVSTNTGDGHEIWTWNDEVSSLEEAKKLGYSNYRSNGSIIDNARIGSGDYGSVYLGFSSDDISYTTSNKEAGPWRTGWEWLSGTGPRNREFHDGDYFAEMLRQHQHYQDAIKDATTQIRNGEIKGVYHYGLSGLSGVSKYLKDYSTLFTFGMTGNLAVTYLGSYDLNWEAEVKGNTAVIHVTVQNFSTMQSASRPPVLGYTKIWQNSIGKMINEIFSSGWGSTTKQTFYLTETVGL